MDCPSIVTIVAKNYLAQARVLIESFKMHHPNGQAFVLLVDKADGYFDPTKENFTVIELEELRPLIDNLEAFCFQYTILELCTAVKPYVMQHIFQQYSVKKLIYFDPDILILNSIDPIYNILDANNIVLTPHITKPFGDRKHPQEIDILRAGVYNLGFIGLKNTAESLGLLAWWQKKLEKQCIVDFANGFFVDQKWMDLVPGFFRGTYVLTDPGYNVAYWNLHERIIHKQDNHFKCNNQPLYFFHYSGWNFENPEQISVHQNRHTLESIGDAAQLFAIYGTLLKKNDIATIKQWPYTYGYFSNGTPISSEQRRALLYAEESQRWADPFKTFSFPRPQQEVIPQQTSIFRKATYRSLKWIYHHLMLGLESIKNFAVHKLQVDKYDINKHMTQPELGVNLIGFIDSEKGVGEICRISDTILRLTSWPHVINRIVDTGSINKAAGNVQIIKHNPYSVNLATLNADNMVFMKQQDLEFQNRYTIANWVWELEQFPSVWFNAFNEIQEVWVPSYFVYEAISKVSPIPVIRMPYAIPIKNKESRFDRAYFNLPENAFIFFFMFDFHSFIARKNPDGLIKAFKKAFTQKDNVYLVIKSSHASSEPERFQEFLALTQKNNILFFDNVMSREEVEALTQLTDCYISLHRSEGFGLTIAEAMSFGKPVIATGYSGNVDFMPENATLRVNYKLVTIGQNYGPYEKGSYWAEPDLDHAAECMRQIYENPEQAKIMGENGREYIIKNYSPQVVSKLYQERLDHIARFKLWEREEVVC